MRRGARSGLFTMVAVHSSVRGPALGGCRMWHYDDARAAMRDVLRLSRAMTFKSAVAGLPLGGGKGIILAPDPLSPARRGLRADALRDFGDAVQSLDGAYITAEDVGTSSRDMEVIASTTSARHRAVAPPRRVGRPQPVDGARRRGGDPRLLRARLRVGVAGRPHDRHRRARPRRRAASRSSAPTAARRCSSPTSTAPSARSPASSARAGSSPTRRSACAADVFVPCALGGVLDHESAARLGAPIVAGAANNQLADDDVAELLSSRGVLWAPDFVVNAGGIINISVELEPDGYDVRRARKRGARHRRHAAPDLRRRARDRRVPADRRDGARARAARRGGGDARLRGVSRNWPQAS